MKKRKRPTGEKRRKKLAFEVELSNRKYRLRLARYRYLAETLGEELPTGSSLVLDAGCGRGRLPRFWGRWAGGGKSARFVGVDLHPRRLRLTRTRGGYGLLVKTDLGVPWPFPDGTFDAVVCEQVLEHFSTAGIHAILSEVRRVLKPNGLALIGTPVFKRLELWLSPVWMRLNRLLRTLKREETTPHLQHFALDDIQTIVRQHGLVPQRVRGYRFFSLPFDIFEDFAWYYRLHRWLGARRPDLCVEATILARRSLQAPGAS
jgi:SAM-dependent methyltransferase